jgi:outer membrane protein TolC
LVQASNNAEVAMMSLKMKLGIEQSAEIELSDDLKNEVQADLLTATFNKEDRVEAKMMDQQIKLQELNVKRYQYSRYPSLFLQASHQQQSVYFDRPDFNDQFLTTWYPGTSVALNVSIPIFTGLNTKTQIDKAQNELAKAKNSADQTMDMLELDYNNSKLTYTQKWKAYQLQVQSVGLAKEIFKTAQIKYKEGVGSSFEMIQAQQDLVNAEIQLTAAAYDLIISETNLKKSLGKL